MPFTPTRRVSRRFPAVFRIIAVLFLFVGGLLAYLDAQETAARRIALSQGAPVPRALEDVRRTGADNVLGEVSVLANSGAPRLVSYRSGGRRQTALVYPLLAAGGQAVRGVAYLPERAQDHPAVGGVGPLQGILGAPPPLIRAAAQELAVEGMILAPDSPAIALYDAPREVVLSRNVRSEWRSVFFWLGLVALTGSYILQLENRRIEAERARLAMARHWAGQAPAPAQPETEKARSRFLHLSEVEEAAPPVARPAGLAQVWKWGRDLLARATPDPRGSDR